MEQDENYYRLPFFKRFGLKIKQKFKDFKTNFHFPWVKFLIFFIVVIILVIVVLIVSKGSLKFPTKKPYDKTGFISADEVTDANYTFENDRYQFIFDVATTHFSIKDKLNNETWLSHPSDKTDVDTLTLYYSKSLGAAKSFGNYSNSIDYNGTKRFNIRVDEEKQSVEVLYLVGGKIEIDYTDLPELISKERLENFVFANVEAKLAELKTSDPTLYSTVNKEYTIAKKSYVLNEVSGIYKLDNPKALSKNYVEKIYDLFYNYALYSKEELNKDNIENGSESSKTYPTFEVSMKYQLTEDGLDVFVENDSIVDYESEPLVYIDVLPYFGCVDTTNKGYALIPDGSGVLLDFNSPRSYANSYESRIYGRELAKVNYTMLPENQNIKFGMFGIHSVVDSIEKGIISAIEKGSETCSILANICTKNQTAKAYNQVYYRYYYRETDTYKFASLAGFSDIQTWTNNYNSTSLKFKLISVKDKGTYSDMASDYKDYLIKKEILKDYSVDSKLSFDLTLLGGYLAEENFLGVTYKKVESLTTSKQVLELANKLKSKSIENVNIIYEGFANGGIKSDYSGNWEYNNAIVSKKELQQLNNQIKDLGMSLYPSVRISSSYTLKQISSNDVIKNLYGANCPYYDASEAELIADETTTPLYYLQGKTYAKTFKEVNKKLNQVGIKNLALLDMGNLIYGTYRSKDTLFRSDTLSSYEEVMKEYVDNYQSIISYAPNDYALKYTSKILDCPFSGTNYQVVLCSVPFYQLVISGYIGYSGESINLNDKESLNYYLMKSLETGSSIAMTWTAEDTIKLIQTEYDNYYSTYYRNWLDKAISMFETLEAISSTHSYLVKHELLNQDGTLTKSTFANGSEIIFNYNTGDVTYDGVTIPKNGYFVLKAGD